MVENLKRRAFISRILFGVGGGLLFDIPQGTVSAECAYKQTGSTDIDSDEMILIPAGTFLMGTTARQAKKLASEYGYHISWLSSEIPQREVNLPAYQIDKFKRQEHRTFIDWFIAVPAKITRSGHQTEIKMYENHFYKADWEELDRLIEAA